MATIRSILNRSYHSQKNHKGLTIISMLGIILGHMVFFLIVSYTWNEKSYDKFHHNSDNIYRLSYSRFNQGVMEYNTANTFYPTGRYLKDNCPAVANYTTIARNYDITISITGKGGQPFFFNEEKGYYAPSSFLSVFSYPVIKGNPNDLDRPNTVFITQSIAQKYFGNQEAIGNTITVNGNTIYTVAGVIKNPPVNTHLRFNFLFSFPTHINQLKSWIDITDHWYGYDLFYTYIQLKDGSQPKTVEEFLPVMVRKNYADKLTGAKQQDVFAMQKLTDIHLYSNLEWETEKPGNGEAVTILTTFAFFILLITWVNYINLISSQAAERAKEVGIRKTLGGSYQAILYNFFAEIAAVNIISVCVAAAGLILAYLLLPAGLPVFPPTVYTDYNFWWLIGMITAGGVCFTSLLSAIIIARFNPIDVLKGKLVITTKSLFLRKSLIAFQFIISFILITGALIVTDQSSFLMHKDKGLNHSSVLSVKFAKILDTGINRENLANVFKQQVKQLKWVKDVTTATDMPEKEIETFGSMYRPQFGPTDGKAYFRIGADDNYFRFFKIKLVAGRFFAKDMDANQPSVILNESAVKKLGYASPLQVIGIKIQTSKKRSATIVGVINDFNYRSAKVKPVATMFTYQQQASYFAIRLYHTQSGVKDQLARLKDIYAQLFPGNPFEYVFLDDAMKQDLQPDINFARLFGAFSIVSIIISLIGLLGLVIVDLNQRVKELGIRKVIGAGFKDIVYLVLYKFSIPLGTALIIGIPVSVWGFSTWIDSYYVYHVKVNAYYFMLPALVLTSLAILIILIQVARVNKQKIVTALQRL